MIGTLLGRYRILEKIGAGGMGEVYRARDENLGRDVAIKILPQGILADPSTRKRFRKEAQAISRLNHPNIATVYDFDTQDDVDFLVMELLQGATLAERLRSGPLPAAAAMSLCTQILSGLEEAHAAGLVHRDLKPQNVFVSPKGHAKVLDFGLAKSVLPPNTLATTETMAALPSLEGTLPYMAPEQLQGGTIDARTDLHAVGAILHEMVTGMRPFAQTETMPLMYAILHQPPPPPVAPTGEAVSPDIARVITRAMAKNPDDRYPSAKAMLADLHGRGEPQGRGAPARAARLGVAIAVAAVAVGTVLLFMSIRGTQRSGRQPADTAAGPERRMLAVVGFKNVSGSSSAAWLATAFAEMISTELAAGERVRIVSGENIARMKRELSLLEADSYARGTLRKIGSNLGSDMVVSGAYTALGGTGSKVRLDVRLQDTSTGETLIAASEIGDEANLFDLVSRIGGRLRAALGVGDVSAAELPAVRASMPSNPDAVRPYTEGLARLRRLEGQAARELLQEAVAADSSFALGHAALARAWAALGYDARALEEAKRALDHSSGLPREDRLMVEADYWTMARQLDKAIETLSTLRTLFPDNIEYGLRLAGVQLRSGKNKEALATLFAMRSLAPPSSDDPRIDLVEATLADDVERRVQLVRAALDKATRQGAVLLAAKAHVALAMALGKQGKLVEARSAFDEAKRTFAATGDRPGLADAQFWSAYLYSTAGDENRAVQELREALVTFRAAGNRQAIASAQNDLANRLRDRGDLDGARQSFEECVRLFHEVGSTGGEAIALGNVAGVLRYQGDLPGARRYYEETLAIERRLGREDGEAWCLSGLAHLEYLGGRLEAAARLYEQSMEACRRSKKRACEEEVTGGLALVRLAQGDFSAARRRYDDVSQGFGAAGGESLKESISLKLARVSVEEGRPEQAEALARAAAGYYHQQNFPVDEAQALGILGSALLAENKTAEAMEVTRRAVALAKEARMMEVVLTVSIPSARALAAAGKPREAESLLASRVAEAQQHGYVAFALEARLALAEIEAGAGKREASRGLFNRVAKEAHARGFKAIARKAEVRLTEPAPPPTHTQSG